jgi:hypothetical protein
MNDAGMDPETADEKSSVSIGIWIVLGVILLVWGGYSALIAPHIEANKFDPLNALFSGLAFWGVIYAILLQKSELELQRRELRFTRSEVRGQKEQLEAQNATLKQQRFENTFFSLVNLFNSIVGSMEFTKGTGTMSPQTFHGRECFILLYNDLQREYSGQEHLTPNDKPLQLCLAVYDRFADYRQDAVGHYFRTFYNIVKFIEKSQVEDKQTYINILRAQLSSSELYLLFYNCLSKYGSQKFKPYVEQFGLLENLTLANLIRREHKDLYNESAFRSSF